MGYVWFWENLWKYEREKIEKKSRMKDKENKNRFKVHKLFFYTTLKLISLILTFYLMVHSKTKYKKMIFLNIFFFFPWYFLVTKHNHSDFER